MTDAFPSYDTPDNKKNSTDIFLVNMFCLFISYSILYIYSMYRGSQPDALDIAKSFSLINIIVLLPSLIKTPKIFRQDLFLQDSQFTLLILFLTTFVGCLTNYLNFSIHPVILIFSGITILFYYIYSSSATVRKTPLVLMVLITGLLCAYILAVKIGGIYYDTITSPLLDLLLPIHSAAYRDHIFDIAVSNIINTHNIPSVGIDGAPYFRYHWGFMWLLTRWANFINISVIKSHLILRPAIIIPLLFKYVLMLYLNISSKNNPEQTGNLHLYKLFVAIWLVVFSSTILVNFDLLNTILAPLGKNINTFSVWPNEIKSPTYALGLFLGLITATTFLSALRISRGFSIVDKFTKFYLLLQVPMMLLILGAAKISVLYALSVSFAYIVLRLKLYKNGTVIYSTLVCILAVLASFVLFQMPQATFLKPFDFIKTCFANKYINFFAVYYFWFWVFLVASCIKILLMKKDNKSKITVSDVKQPSLKFFDIELGILICLAMSIPGNLLFIKSCSGYYFIDVIRWAFLPLALSVIDQIMTIQSSYKQKL